uniref:immunoglobulin-like domain-containing protein n=1 Tax=Pseudomonas sp. TaxID=306 RepID=UPI0028AEC71C
MSSVVAIVKTIVGQVVAVSAEGVRRFLVEGDRIYTGEQILTGEAGAVTLEFTDGRMLDLGRDTQWSANVPDQAAELSEATAQSAPSVQELQQAIAAGLDPTTELEAPAAGQTGNPGGAAGGGHSFVLLSEVGGEVDPTIGYPTEPLQFAAAADDVQTGGQDTSAGNAAGVGTGTGTDAGAGAGGGTGTGAGTETGGGTGTGTDAGAGTGGGTGTTGGGNTGTDATTLTVTLAATPTVSEAGGVIVYTATVNRPPLSDLSLTLSNGAVILIPAGQSQGTVNVNVNPGDTVYIDDRDVSASIVSGSGGGEPVLADTTPAVTQILDTIDTTTLTLSATPSVTEGGVITYTVVLDNPAQTPVTVTLSNGQTLVIQAGQATASIDAPAPADDAYAGQAPVSVSITGATGGNFENLVADQSPVTTAVTDVATTTTLSLAATPSVAEGGSIVYTATLSNPAGTPVTVTLSNGQVITIAANQTSGSVTVAAPGDDPYVDGGNVSAQITGATGGNFENLAVNGTPAVTAVTDTIDTTAVTLTAASSVAEGGVITYTASVGAPVTGSPVLVTLANGQTITIAVGQSSGTVNVPVADDAYQGNAPVVTNITNVSGGNYENLVADQSTVTTAVTDVATITTLSLAATPSVAEGGSIVYTATLSNPAGTPVTVTLSNGQVITIAANQTSGSVTVAAPGDDPYIDGGNVSAQITNATGGNFENLVVNGTPAVTAVTDTIDTTTVTLTAASSVAEGGVITYTASVGAPVTGTPVIVTLSNGQAITIAVGQSSGTVNVPVADDAYQGNAPVVTNITNVSGGNYENLVADQSTVTTAVTDVATTTTLSLAATPSVAEGGSIVYTATLSNPAGTPVTVTLSNGQVITIAANQTSGSVTVAAPGDDPYIDGGNVSAQITNATGGNFENLVVNGTPAVTAVTDTIDTTTVTLTAASSVAEGGVITYTASVGAPVTGTPVIVTLSNGQAITIAVGQSSGTVNVPVADDAYQGNAPVVTNITNVSGGNYENLVADQSTVTTAVTDVATTTTLSLAATPSVAEGGSIVYTATLSNPAGTPVTVTLSNGQVITIAANQTSGSVTVAAPGDDPYIDGGNVSAQITNATGGNFENLAVNGAPAVTAVTDTIDTTTVTLTAASSVAEGGVITYTASVGAPVTGSPVLVTLANGQTITIAVGQSSGTVNVPVADDAYQGNAPVVTNITTVSGGNYENLVADQSTVTTAVTDVATTTTLSLTATPSVAEGGSIVYTATLSNPAGSPVTVTLSNGQVITIAANQTSGSVTVAAPGDDPYIDGGNVSAQITNATGGNFENLAVNGAPAVTAVTDTIDTTTVTLTAASSVAEGGVITYTASVGAPVTGSPVLVTLANGQTITIAVGQSSGTVNVPVADDAYQGNAPVVTNITNVSGGNYENLVADQSPVATAVTDVATTTTLSLAATPSVAEGGSIVYTATLSNPAGTPVTVTLSNGQVITIAANQTSGSVTVAAPGDDPYIDGGNVSAQITNATGGNFENLAVNGAPAVTAVTDTIDTTTVTLTAASSVAEGGVITYTASVGAPVTGSPVVVKLSNGETIIIAVGQSVGTVTTPVSNDVYQGHAPVDNSIASVSGGNYENLVANQTPVTTTVTDVQDTTTVVLSATPSVAEGGTIVYTATVASPVTGSPVVITLSNGQSIIIAVGQTSGTVNTPVSNDVYQGHAPVTANITGVSGGNFENLAADQTPVTTTVTDVQDTTTVVLSATPSVAEGGTIVYTATVADAVTGSPVVVTLSNGQSITIAVGQTSGTINTPVSNDVYQGHAPVTANITTVSGGSYENLVANQTPVTTQVTDVQDTTTVTLTATPSVAEGGSITYTASVNAPVTGSPVVVKLANGETITIAVGQSAGTVTTPVSNDVYQGHAPVDNSIVSVSGGNYENLVANQAPVTTQVTDVQDTTTVVLSATPSVAEGGTIVYTATVADAVTGSPVVVTLSNGQSITIAVGQTSGTINTPVSNDVYQGHAPVTANITTVSGGSYENLVANQTPVTTQVTDVQDTTTVTLTATPSVAEGGTIVYTATVADAVTGSPVVVTLSNGQSITIAVGQTSGTVNTPVSNDVYQGHAPVTANITTVSGGSYENLVANQTPVTTTVTDVQDTTTVVLSATPSVAEGGTIVYTATVADAVTGSPVVVTLSNGQSITIAVGQTSGTVNTPVSNDVYQGHAPVTANITGVTGGNFENLVANPAVVTTAVTDVVDTTTVTLTATPSVAEGGSITYTASVNAPVTGSPVVVKLANGETITIAVGQSAGTVTTPVSNDVYQGHAPVDNSIASVSGGNYENLAADQTPVTTTVTDVQDTTTVVLSATPSVAEGGTIVYTATVADAVTGSPVVVALSNGQSITIAVGQTSGTVNTPVSNDVYQGHASVTANITTVSGGSYENLVANQTPVTTTVTDVQDTTTVVLSATPSVAEGGTIVYTATVADAVTGSPVVVTLSNGQSITIAVGQTSGTVNTPVSNDVYQGHAPVTANITGVTGGNFENLVANPAVVTTSVTDVLDTTTVTLTATPSVAEGGSITYTASVNAPVTGSPVVVKLANGETITIAVGQSAGTVTTPVSNDVYQGHAPVDNSIASVSGGNYENLAADQTPVTTTVTDVQDTTTVVLSATPSVAEGGTIVYTATVADAVTGSPVVVALSNGQSITIAVGQTSGTVNTPVSNDVYQGHAPVTANITTVSGGSYENLVANQAPVTTQVTDVQDTTTVTLTATPSVAEGGTIVYTATVADAVTGSPVVVTLSNGQSITIAVGQTSGTVNTPVSNDVYQGHAPVTANITTVSGGSYENLVANQAPVTTQVTDVQDTTTVVLSATPSVAEGGSITYTASVNAPVTGSPVVVKLANGETITIAVGQSAGTVTTPVSNDVYQGHAPVGNSIASVSGGNYENLTADQTPVTTTVTDVQDTTTVVLSATPSVAEGGTIVYTATVADAVTGSPVVVTLSNGQSITIAVGQTSGTVNTPVGNDVYQGHAPVTANITTVSGGSYENLVANQAPVTTQVTDIQDTTTVVLSATPSVAEGGTIVYTATVADAVTGSPVVVTLSNGQSITIAVGQTSGTVNTPVGNDVYQGHAPVTANITTVSGGSYENLVANQAPVTTQVTDIQDTTTVVLSATPSVAEGGTIVYTATVADAVTGSPVVVTLSNGQSITIAVGQTSGTVNTPVGNDVYQGHAPVTANITTVSGGSYENLVANQAPVTTQVTDIQDTTTVVLSATPSVAEGGSITYTASVNAPVTGSPVVVKLANGETITIAVGQSAGTVTTPVSNDVYQGHAPVDNSIASVSGGNYENLVANQAPVTTQVTDVQDSTTVVLSATPSVAEGGTIVYTATVADAVTGSPVVVTLSNGQSITIAVGQTSGTVNTPVSNDVYQGHAPVTANITTVSGGSYENLVANQIPVTTQVTDVQDTTTVVLSATPSVAEGGTIVYTATVADAVTGSPVVVTLSNGQSITIAVGQTSGTVNTPVSNDVYQGHAPVTANITGVTGGNFENLVANPAVVTTAVTDVVDTTTVTLTATPSVAEGGSITYTASVNAPVTGSPVVVKLANGETITIAVGQSAGTVTTPVSNDVYQGHAPVGNSIASVTGGNFENLVANPAVVTTAVTDVVDTTTVTLTATPSVAEGGSITYTASVNAPVTGSPVVVKLANGETITIAVGQSAGTVTTPVSNDVYQGHAPVDNSIASVSGGNYENLVANQAPVTTQVTDVQDTTTVVLSATPSVAEGGTIVYTATVADAVTGSPVVVTLSNGQSITIAVGQTSGTVNTPVSNDVYQGHAPVTANITTVSGGSYENLVANQRPVTTTVTDVQDTTTVVLSATPSVAEGGSIVYTASVSAPVTGSPVVVKLANGETITIAVGQSSGTATTPVTNDVYVGHAAVTNSISNVSGGNYENLVAVQGNVTTTVTDTVDTSTVTLTATPSVAEGGSIVYTASVSAPVTGSPVVVKLANGETITIAVGQSSGTATTPVANDVYVGHAAVTNSISNVSGGSYENLVATQGNVTTTVTDTVDTSTVTLTATPSVAEGGSIVYTASVSAPVTGAPVVVKLANGETITIAVGQSAGTVTTPVSNDVYQGHAPVDDSIISVSGGNYENLAADQTPVTTTVTDVQDTTTVVLSATPSVAEGGTIVYTATVADAVTGSPVVVTLSNGQSITIAVGQTSGTINTPVSNDVYQGHAPVTANITTVSGGDYENLVANQTPVTTTITDVQDTTTVVLSATPSVAEGGTIVYTATVADAVTGSPVVVTLSNGQSITIAVGQTSGTINTPVSNDVYQGHAPVTANITTVSGGDYENLVANQTPVTTTVTDVQDTTTVVLSATPSVAEGGTIVYTATVASPVTGAPVVVTLSNGQSITIAVGQTSGTVNTPVSNDVYQGHAPVTANITNVTGGNFENLVANPAVVTTSVTDVVDTTTVTLTATPSVAEGGSITYTASVNAPVTGSPVVVKLANGETITIAVGQSSGTATTPVTNDVYVGHAAVINNITTVSGGNYESLVANQGAVTTTVTDTVDTSTVTLTATPSVAEGGSIVYTASVSAPVTGSPIVVKLANGETITIAVGQSSGTATTPVTNDVYVGHAAVTNNITTVSGGNYENLVANQTAVTTTVTDVVDTSTVTLTATPSVAEGGSIVYTASVSAPVTGSPVVVKLANGETITIAVGQSSGTATTPVTNDVYVGHATVTNSISNVSGGNYENLVAVQGNVTTTVTDTVDTSTVTLTATPSVAEGGSIVYTASVSAPVTGAPVVVKLANGETITIAVGQSAGTVTTPVSNDVYQGHAPVDNSIASVSGGNYENLAADQTPVTTTVTDVQDTTTVVLSATPSVAEGGTIVYTATVADAVTGSPVVVTLSNGQSITIAVGQTSGTVNTPVSNDVYQGHAPVTANITGVTGGNFENLAADQTPVTTTVTDVQDTTTVVLSATPSVAEGGTIVYTATVADAVTGSPVVVTLSNGQSITIAVGQTSGTINTPVSNDVYQGHAPVTANITTVSGGSYENLVANQTPVTTTVTDVQDTTTVVLSATPSVAEGGTIVYTATVADAVTGSPVVVTLSNGQSITIAVGQTSGTVNTPVSNDVYQGHAPVTANITTVSGGSYENLVANQTPVTTQVTDVQDTTTVVLSATPSVAEGGTIVYTATVADAVTGSPVVVTLSNGQSITIAVGQTSGTVNTPVSNDVYQGHAPVTANIATVSGGSYENLVANQTPVTTTVTDVQDTTTVVLSATPSVAEGGSIVYTASVSAPVTGSPVVVKLANGETITIAVGQSSGTATTPVTNDVYVGHAAVTNNITTVSGGNYESLVANQAAVTTTVTDTVDTSTVTLTATPSVAEGGSIVYTASVSSPVTGAPVVVKLANGETITIAVGQSSGTATTPVTNDVYVGHAAVTNSISNVSGGNYESLVANQGAVTTTVTDTVDTSTVTLTATPSVAEGGSIVYTASVSAPVTGAPVVVKLVNGESITIAVGQSSGTATTPVTNDVYVGHAAVTNSISNVSGGNYESLVANQGAVTTTVTDTVDTSTVTLTATPSVAEGGSIVYTASVSAPVTGSPVVVKLANGETITIAVGQSSGTATTPVTNDVYVGHAAVTNSISNVSGGSYENLVATQGNVTTTVTDTVDTSTVTLTATPSVAEGGSIVYTASVSAPVTGAPVVVKLANGETITIAVGQSAGTVTTPVSNDVYQGHAPVD